MPNKQVASKTSSSKSKARRLKPPRYASFRLSKRIKHPGPKIPGAFKIFGTSIAILRKYWKGFAGITVVYLVLSLLLVRGFVASDLPALKQLVAETLQGRGGDITVGFTVFGLLLGTSSQTATQVGGTYQLILVICMSLVVIWALRQAHAGTKFGVKEAFYKAFHPFVPFLAILLVIGLQLLPFLAASILYNVLFLGEVAQGAAEKFAWALLMGLLVLWSLYMLTASVFSLYIVTLPEMMPLQALRSARELVRYRRWTIMRKVLFLPFISLVIAVVIMVPAILFLTPVAEWLFVVLTAFGLVFTHSYMYSLYRELL